MNYTLITETDMYEFDTKTIIDGDTFVIFQNGKHELKFNKNYIVAFFPSGIKLKKMSFSDLQNEKTINSLANFTQNIMDNSFKMINDAFPSKNNDIGKN